MSDRDDLPMVTEAEFAAALRISNESSRLLLEQVAKLLEGHVTCIMALSLRMDRVEDALGLPEIRLQRPGDIGVQ